MNLRKFLLSSGALLCGLAVLPASAQQLALEEIIVTSKQREQNLQDVPLNITAFTSDDLMKQNIFDVRDLAALTPSFTYYSGTGRADPTALVVRGLAPNTSDERYQALSIFVDGIFQSGQLTSIDLSNLERVEVIKGPQSATFGRATYSGAVDYITRTPRDNEITGTMRGQWSSNDGNNNHHLSLRVDFPVVEDKLWMSVNGTSLRRGEIGKNPVDNTGIGIEETSALGITIYAEPNDDTSIKFRVAHDRDRDTTPLFYVNEPPEWVADGASLLTLANGSVWVDGKVPDPHIGRAGGGLFLKDARPEEGGRDRNRFFFSLVVETDVMDGHELSYRGGYFDDKFWANSDFYFRPGTNDPFFGNRSNRKSRAFDGTGSFLDVIFANAFNAAFQERFKNTSHQVRLVSPGDEPLRYTVGAYYFYQTSINTRETQFVTPDNPRGLARGPEKEINYAAFGGVSYDLSDQVTLSAEARVARSIVKWLECGFCAQTRNVGNAGDDRRTHISPRFTAEYKPNDDTLLYALAARGYKSTRFNTGTTGQFLPPAEPERLDNFELGAKNTLMDGQAILNIALYYMDVKKQQAFFPIPVDNPDGSQVNTTGVGNFGDSRVYGFEVEGNVVVAQGLTLAAALGMNDHKYTSDSPPLNDFQLFAPDQTIKGLTSVNTAKWSGTASIDYTFPVAGGDYEMTLRSDVTYRSKIFVDRANLAYFPANFRVNAKAILEKDEWQMSLFVRDLFDERTPDGAGLSGSSGCLYSNDPANADLGFQTNQRCLSGAPPRGREIGVEAILNF